MQEQCSRMCAIISDMPAASIRARVRAELTDEIKQVARRHLATDGANLSLRAVARDMGMVSSALYRYFASRDELLTALILDGYNALGGDVEAADATVADRALLRGRFLAATTAVRNWALAHPAEYALLYGSPVPGYAAPPDTIAAAARMPVVLLRILADGTESGRLSAAGYRPSVSLPRAVAADLARTRAAMTSFIQLLGFISLELFGQFTNVIDARSEFFSYQMELMADLIGLPREHQS
jgi:AcrR family transcriptional regulator